MALHIPPRLDKYRRTSDAVPKVPMPRVDIWDVVGPKQEPAVDCGFSRDLEAHFEWGRVLGKGGFGLVR